MKIAYLCDISPLEPWGYSGGNANMYRALCEQFGEVHILQSGWGLAEPLRHLVNAMPEAITLRTRWRLHLLLGRLIAKNIARQLAKDRYDVLFCPYSFHSLAGLKLPYEMTTIFTSDATPTSYKRSRIGAAFGSYFSASRVLDPLILRAEKRVFSDVSLVLWPSQWMQNSARDLFDLLPPRSQVIPWGANVPDREIEFTDKDRAIQGTVKLLLVGRDWFAKGGPTSFAVLQALQERGIPAQLDVVGCEPPVEHRNAAVKVHGVLSKSDPEQFRQFTTLFQNAHFMVMPSFESYGFAFCEASAFGLPSLCMDVGGVPVRNGVNGYAFDVDADVDDYVNCIVQHRDDPEKYNALCRSTRRYYETDLNWRAWAQSVENKIHQHQASQ